MRSGGRDRLRQGGRAHLKAQTTRGLIAVVVMVAALLGFVVLMYFVIVGG